MREGGACLDTAELAFIFGKLFLSRVLGGLIGYEREARHKSATFGRIRCKTTIMKD